MVIDKSAGVSSSINSSIGTEMIEFIISREEELNILEKGKACFFSGKWYCSECDHCHSKNEPHAMTIAYNFNFFEKKGRCPTEQDAIEHLSEQDQMLYFDSQPDDIPPADRELLKQGIRQVAIPKT